MERWLLVAIVALLIVVIFLLIRRRPRPGSSPVPVTTTAVEPEVGAVDLSDVFRSIGISEAQTDQQTLVIPQDSDGTALVVGEKSVAQRWGTLVAEAGPQIQATARRSSASVQAGISGAERAGYLVKLHPDSVKALKTLKSDAAKGALGYINGTLRDGSGHYAHVIKIKQVANLQTLSSGAAILSALAMQAQLDRIEKSLAKVQASVDMLADEQHDLEDAKRDALEASFGETYRIAHQTGELTRVQWEALPPVTEAYALRASTLRALQRERDRLKGLPSGAKDRSDELVKIARRLDRVLANLDRDDRLVGQAQVLLLWRMSSTKDPALPAALQDVRTQVAVRLQEREEILASIESLLIDLDVRSILQKIWTSRRRKLRASGHELSWEVREHREVVAEATSRQLMIGAGPDQSVSETYALSQQEAVILTIAQLWMMRSDAYFDEDASKRRDFDVFLEAAEKSMASVTDADAKVALASFSSTSMPGDGPFRRLCSRSGSRVRSLLLLIELVAFHPWSPRDPERPLKTATAWDRDSRLESLRRLSGWLTGTTEEDADTMAECYGEVLANAGKGGRNWWVIGGLTATGVALGALTGGLAAPAIGAFIGTTVFGLSGAAATSAGLAALGGGSLAAGGFGMAGGTALIASVGGIAGAGLAGGATSTAQTMGTDERRNLVARMAIDLVKLQVLARVVLINELHDYDQVTVVVQSLRERRGEVEQRLKALGQEITDEEIDPDAVPTDEKAQLKLLARALDRAVDDLLRRRAEDSRVHRS